MDEHAAGARLRRADGAGDPARRHAATRRGQRSRHDAELLAPDARADPRGDARRASQADDRQCERDGRRGETNSFKTFNYELGTGQRWAILQIILHPKGERLWLAGVYVQPADRSPSIAHAFSFRGKRAIHYLWLAMMLAAVATSITSLVLVLRTRGLRRKWLWAVGSALGFVSFQLNWTTGEWGIWPISIQLFGASALQNGPLLPWVMSFAIPVVAIIFLVRRAMGAYAADDASGGKYEDPTAGN